MDRINSSLLATSAIGAVMLALPAPPSSAQQPGAATLGEAQLLPGGEWGIGRWEGTLVMIGTVAGGTSLNKAPRLLTVEKDSAGKLTCRFVPLPAPSLPEAGLTKRCVVGPNGISLISATSTEIELSRSGPDGLQGPAKPPFAVGVQGAGFSGMQVHMNRVR